MVKGDQLVEAIQRLWKMKKKSRKYLLIGFIHSEGYKIQNNKIKLLLVKLNYLIFNA